jgi:uncharacterized protein
MAHESFEDPEVGRLLNERFVSIKVDREERPDVDAVYMTATQAMTGHGGWPMTVFATPDGQPFFCGTYFPRPQFVQLLDSVAAAWRDRRPELLQQGAAVTEALARIAAPAGGTTPLGAELLDAAALQLAREHDQVNGGFGSAPKFPPHMNLLFLLRHHERTGDPRSLEIVRHTAEQMARGGLYDQLAGGFARYSVDATWTVPHFEKMLYDNALLLRVYTHLWRMDGEGLLGRIARETAGFLLTDLRLPDGGFASALDADTGGVEGATYVWTPAQLRETLGDQDGAWAADLFGVTENGNFGDAREPNRDHGEHGTSVLRLRRDIDDADPEVVRRWARVRERLREARTTRPQPARDDKVVAAWNGLAVTALAEHLAFARTIATVSLDGPMAAVRRAAELLERHIVDGRLRRVSYHGSIGRPAGVLEDYGCVAEAFCAVHQLTGEGHWLALAGQLLDTALARFGNGQGGFFDTADDAERLVARLADPTDNATPAGLTAVAAALTSYAALTGETSYRTAAETALATVAPIAATHARFTGYACAVGEALLSGPYEIAIVTDDPASDPLVGTARRFAPPGAVIVAGEPDQPGVPLLADRPRLDGASTAYVCRGFVCDRPVTAEAELATQLTA